MSKTIERQRAERGAALLDEKKPGWEWHEEFDDLRTLDIKCGCNCVLGKLYGNRAVHGSNGFFIGIDVLDLNTVFPGCRASDYGFTGSTMQTRVWREIITQRREDALSSVETGLEDIRSEEAPVALSEHPVAV